MPTLFHTLSSATIADIIRGARNSVCYAAPGIQMEPARAIADAAESLGVEMLTVSVDFDERVMRMGFGSVEALSALRNARITVHHSSGLRSGLLVVDDEGFIFTPTPLYLEPEPCGKQAPNALRLSREQLTEALARLSMAAKAIAVARAETREEKTRLSGLPIDLSSTKVGDARFRQVEQRLKEVPPVPFDLARQVRVFEPYLQYVEMSLSGAAIERHRLAIPSEIQRLGGSKDLEGRLRTTFDLIERTGKLSSKTLEDELNDIRRNFTPSLGKDHGRVVLKAAKPHLVKRLDEFRAKLAAHQKTVETELQKNLDKSRDEIVEYYLSRVVQNPPDSLLGQLLSSTPGEEDARKWLDHVMKGVFPTSRTLVHAMKLAVYFKDVTFETLNEPEFLESIKKAFPNIDWDKAYEEFKAAGESAKKGAQA